MSLAHQAAAAPRVTRIGALEALLSTELPHLVLEGVLGEGATAYVFAARHVLLELDVAIKLLRDPAERDPAGAARMRREARILATLRADCAPRALDANTLSDGTPYFVMTRGRGKALSAHADLCDLSVSEVVEIGCGLLDALAGLHAQGILHRDVKPDNVVLDGRKHGRTRVRLIDLGLAKILAEGDDPEAEVADEDAVTLAQLTQPGTFVGTPSYIAPEQLMARAIDARADLYAAGATLYHLLTGVPPFHHDDVHLSLAACLRDPLPAIASLRRGVPERVAAVVERAMARDPTQRFDSALDMLRALRGAAGASSHSLRGATVSLSSGFALTAPRGAEWAARAVGEAV